MERESPNGSPAPEYNLGREIYLTPQQVAIAALVDAMDARVSQKLKEEDADETTE